MRYFYLRASKQISKRAIHKAHHHHNTQHKDSDQDCRNVRVLGCEPDQKDSQRVFAKAERCIRERFGGGGDSRSNGSLASMSSKRNASA
jgi:hypothetical protein